VAESAGSAEMPLPWSAQLLRLTLFLASPVDGSALWEKVTGETPEIDEHRPRANARRQAGRVGDAFLDLQIGISRLDWVLTPAPPLAPSDLIIYMGTVPDAVSKFDALLLPWLGAGPEIAIQRMALGLIAMLPVPDRAAAYARLQELVPSVRYDPERAREVMYQVNRPSLAQSVPGMEINRVTKWASIRAAPMEALVAGGRLTSTSGTEESFVHCECDHSTPVDRIEPFSLDQLVPIYQELRDLAVANLEKGEIP
jgi:hypothetical protein